MRIASNTRPAQRRFNGRITRAIHSLLALSCAILGGHHCLVAEEAAPLQFGMSTALEGPAATLGRNMRDGVLCAFAEANRAGGIHGRKLELRVLNDGYEPEFTVPNLHRLIDGEKVLGIIGNVGTPTAVAAIPIINQKGVPFFGAYTGAGVLRKTPPDRYVINYRASYVEESTAMVDALVEVAGIRPEEIAFFTQRDAYGDAGYTGGIAALKRHGLEHERRVAHGRYERNTLAVENGLADILFHDPPVKAVIMVGAYAPCAEFILLAHRHQFDALFLSVSFVGAAPLNEALGPAGDGVIVTQVVPHIEAELPVVRAFRTALKAYDPALSPTFGGLEGYIAARILCRALENLKDVPTRESIIAALEALGEFDIGLGVPLTLGPEDHQACATVWPTIIRNERIVPFSWNELAPANQGGEDD